MRVTVRVPHTHCARSTPSCTSTLAVQRLMACYLTHSHVLPDTDGEYSGCYSSLFCSSRWSKGRVITLCACPRTELTMGRRKKEGRSPIHGAFIESVGRSIAYLLTIQSPGHPDSEILPPFVSCSCCWDLLLTSWGRFPRASDAQTMQR